MQILTSTNLNKAEKPLEINQDIPHEFSFKSLREGDTLASLYYIPRKNEGWNVIELSLNESRSHIDPCIDLYKTETLIRQRVVLDISNTEAPYSTIKVSIASISKICQEIKKIKLQWNKSQNYDTYMAHCIGTTDFSLVTENMDILTWPFQHHGSRFNSSSQ